MTGGFQRFLVFIRFSHTIFAMPFALGAMFVAADGIPPLQILGLAMAAMVFARTAAMTFNRLADWELDKRNPRTEGRHRLVTRKQAVAACALASTGFFIVCFFINPLCFALSPVALFAIFFYSLTKRFTHFAQFFLGLALSIAPVGGWIAVTGSFALPPLILAAGVLCWVAGFDVIYATQDFEVDKNENLKSLVVGLGISRALVAAGLLHALAFVAFVAFGVSASLGSIYNASFVLIACALVYEHLQARKPDLAAINRAFFTSNAAVGLIFASATLLDRVVHV